MAPEMPEKKLLKKSSPFWARLKAIDPLVLPAFCVGLPMAWFTASIALSLLWSLFLKGGLFSIRIPKIFYLFAALYLLYYVGIWDSEDPLAWMHKIRGKVFYVLIPLAFTRAKVNLDAVKKAWVYGTLLTMALLLFAAFIRFAVSDNPLEFFYGKLSLYGHPSYLGFIALVALLFSWQLDLKQGERIFFTSLSILYIYLLSARAVHIAAVPVALILLTQNLRKPKKLRSYIVALLVGVLACFTINSITQGKMNRSREAVQVIKANTSTGTSSTAVRIDMWGSLLKHVEEYLPMGAGAGFVEDRLQENWKEDGLHYLVDKGYNNVHNQYLQQYAATGILGLVLLLILIASSLKGFSFKKNYLPLAFFITMSVCLLFECLIERQMGITAITMLLCILHYPKKETLA